MPSRLPRPSLQPAVATLWLAQRGLRRGYLMDVATALFIGSHLLISGRARTKAASWETLNTNGGPMVWGTVLLVLGIALIAATFWGVKAVMVMLALLGVFYGMLALWFLVSAMPIETGASFVGAWFAGRTLYDHLSRAWAYWSGGE